MAAHAEQIRLDIVRPALERIDLWSAAAEELILGTIAQESAMGKYHRQLGGGPALGIVQMEPATHDDCWINYLKYHPALAKKIMALAYGDNLTYPHHIPDPGIMEHNDVYAVAMCRVKYLRVSASLPAAHDLIGIAEYWKKYYNTPLGKGTVTEFCENYVEHVC